VVGVYDPSDEGAATEDAKHGRFDGWTKVLLHPGKNA
jgi:hypothetical protein